VGLLAVIARSIIPSPLAEACYDVIATNRYRVFGRTTTCQMPSKDTLSRMWDVPGAGASVSVTEGALHADAGAGAGGATPIPIRP